MDGNTMRLGRTALGWTQAKLAVKAGVSVGTIIRLEAGTGDPKLSTLMKIQGVLEAAGVEFLGDTGVQLRPKS
jgi:transcriptional regulator with XRE-family HTH domain